MNPSSNLFLIGPTGAGKTSIGRRLASHFQRPFLDLDAEIEASTGVDIPRIFEVEGEAGFRRREAELLDALSQREGIILASGAGAILDAVNRQHLAARGFVLWLDVSVAQQLARLALDRSRPLLAAPDRQQRLETMAATRTALYQSIADLHIPGHDEAVDQAARRTQALLEAVWIPLNPVSP